MAGAILTLGEDRAVPWGKRGTLLIAQVLSPGVRIAHDQLAILTQFPSPLSSGLDLDLD